MGSLSRWTVVGISSLSWHGDFSYRPQYKVSSKDILGGIIFVASDDFTLYDDNLTLGVL